MIQSVKNKQKELGAGKPQERRVKTDFYEGSIVFDSLHTRAGHGYWQSDCEMFARAFDCYISDKIKADGNRSDYLSARADSFITTGSDGKPAAAIPQGEERAVLNEKFDLLIDALKERGILHDHTEVLEEEKQAPESAVMEDIPYTAEELANSEQLSFDDLLFSAQQRVDTPNSLGSKISKVR